MFEETILIAIGTFQVAVVFPTESDVVIGAAIVTYNTETKNIGKEPSCRFERFVSTPEDSLKRVRKRPY